ncbi:MAG: VOC family protein [Nevskia sp.]|nr:VOC family protein [Nevskia sp.]
MHTHLRIARPVSDVARAQAMYCAGLGLRVVGRFNDAEPEGFEGVMLGSEGCGYHFEFTLCRGHAVAPAPTAEDLLVFYLPDAAQWRSACARILAAGFVEVDAFNPYWAERGRSFADPDGYRVVLENDAWSNGDQA